MFKEAPDSIRLIQNNVSKRPNQKYGSRETAFWPVFNSAEDCGLKLATRNNISMLIGIIFDISADGWKLFLREN